MSDATPTMNSIGLASGRTRDISTISNDEKNELIISLQQELEMLREQVGEFNNLRMSVIKTTGNNGVRKLKDKYLTTTDKVNANEIAYLLRKNLWPHVKLMPKKCQKWSENSKSICQRIMSIVALPSGFIPKDYWMGVARSLANKKMCAMRSNIKKSLFHQFKGMYMNTTSVYNICLLTLFLSYISFYGTVDHRKEDQMVVYENEMACPSVRNWTKTEGFKLAYEEAKHVLYFLDNYTTVMVGWACSMIRYYKNYKGKT
jgi:hypothetical protein